MYDKGAFGVAAAMKRQAPIARAVLVEIQDLRQQLAAMEDPAERELLTQRLRDLCGGSDPGAITAHLEVFVRALERGRSLEATSAWVRVAPILMRKG